MYLPESKNNQQPQGKINIIWFSGIWAKVTKHTKEQQMIYTMRREKVQSKPTWG